MATNRLTENESAGVGTLVKGIVEDLERLAIQHIKLLKKDVREDLAHLKAGLSSLTAGLVLVLIGGGMFGIMVALALLAIFPDLPAWVAYGISGLIFVVGGGICVYCGQKQLQSAAFLAERTREALEEDAKWLNQPK